MAQFVLVPSLMMLSVSSIFVEHEDEQYGTTVDGCSCRSRCRASASDGFNCSWCHTRNGCGKNGKWDFCNFPEDPAFTQMSWQQKNQHFWASIIADRNRAPAFPGVSLILTESVQLAFDNWGEVLPRGRRKVIHAVGSICQFKFEVTRTSPYTGLLGPGTHEGFIRMGSAADYTHGGLTPGIGIKFARTGVHSAGFVALNSLDLGQSWNFFKNNLSNHISPPCVETSPLARKFQQASQCGQQVGISDLARFSQDGTPYASPLFPFKLFLVPSGEVQTPERPKTVDQVHAEMAAFKIGTTLYNVFACSTPTNNEMTPTFGGLAKSCGSHFLLGAIVTTSECTTSKYGDFNFHVRHQRIEEDWRLNPSYLKQYDAARACGWQGEVSPEAVPRKCVAPPVGMLQTDVSMLKNEPAV
eukprot:TRINITY_DN56661_c0_g1_i1.p1 TRINITY_DN56661_c0_g1~~TRINITY_DN56661_c0_g1_i1.p1  ORF type:complete len:436 (+),score=42.56 TRINITY_DN56661_c0_g1_i1:71-1309(+)